MYTGSATTFFVPFLTRQSAVGTYSYSVGPDIQDRVRTLARQLTSTDTVMGGIFVQRESNTIDKTPVLHRIPLLGWLFKTETRLDDNRELLIFITPRISK